MQDRRHVSGTAHRLTSLASDLGTALAFADDAERRREIERQYRERNADAVKAKNARHREATKEHRAEYDRRWAAANREKSVAKTMRWRAKNPAYHVEAVRR